MKPVFSCEVAALLVILGTLAMAAPQISQEQPEETKPPVPYSFDYTIRDEINAVMSARVEEGDAQGVIRGSYTYVRPDGIIQTTSYVADANGFRAETKEELAGGLEVPNPAGNVEVSVNLPGADPISYQYTADQYQQILASGK